MNRLFFIAAISWQSRNWRHAQRAERWCKDYGLTAVHENFYIGKLYIKERDELNKKLTDLFIGKTERYCSLILCASCAQCIHFHSEIEKTPWLDSSYEIIQTDNNP